MNKTALSQVSIDLILLSDDRTTAEQILITSWCIISLFLGLVGNSALLYTLYHKALHLDSTSKWIVLNLALADLSHTTLVVLPMTITNAAGNTWILGRVACVINSVFVGQGIVARIVLVNAFAALRLLRCAFPFWRSRLSGVTSRALITIAALAISSIFPVWNIVAQVNEYTVAVFWGAGSKCAGWPLQYHTVHRILTIALFGIPCIPLTISNLTLIGFAIFKSKARKSSPNKKNICMVLMVTFLLLLSLIPINMINFFNNPLLKMMHFLRFATLFLNVSAFLNPFVFFVTHSSLRQFFMRKVFQRHVQERTPSNNTVKTNSNV